MFPHAYFADLDCDGALEVRDRDPTFCSSWVAAFDQVNRRRKLRKINAAVIAVAEELRREAFLVVSQATRQHEIASYVSDDFDLIVRARVLDFEDPFVNQLWLAYEKGAFPLPLAARK